MASTNDPIKSLAARCGFPNAAAFCVRFRKTMHISPQAGLWPFTRALVY